MKQTSTTNKRRRYSSFVVSGVVAGSAVALSYGLKAALQLKSPEFNEMDSQTQADVRSLARMTNVYCISAADWRLLKQAFPQAKTFAELMVDNFGSSLTKMQSLFKTSRIVRAYDGPNPNLRHSKENELSFEVFRRIFANNSFKDELAAKCTDKNWEDKCVKSGWLSGLENACEQFNFFEASRSDMTTVEKATNLYTALTVFKEIEDLPCDRATLEFLKGTHFSNTEHFTEVFDSVKVKLLDNDRLPQVKSDLLFEVMQFCFK